MQSEFNQRQKNDILRDISSLGSLIFYIIICVFFLFLANYELLAKLIVGALIIYIVTILLRTVLFKERPKRYNYNSYIEKLDAASFPSFHAARSAFMGAVFVGYFRNTVITIILVLMVLLIAYTRIYLKKHDLKDVSAGIVLGILVYFAINYIV